MHNLLPLTHNKHAHTLLNIATGEVILLDYEVEKCSRCGKSLRDIDPTENDQPVTVSNGQELCSRCYQDLVDGLTVCQ